MILVNNWNEKEDETHGHQSNTLYERKQWKGVDITTELLPSEFRSGRELRSLDR